MAKKTTRKNNPVAPASATGESYAYKPLKIGAIIEDLVIKKGLTERQIGTWLKINWRHVYKIYKCSSMSLKRLLQWSELLGENLLLLYHPNVKPKPNPLQEELDAMTAERDELLRNQDNFEAQRLELIRVKAERDLLDDKLERFLRR